MTEISVFLNKLIQPSIPHNAIERQRLITKLSELNGSGLGFICAAAGYGKTVLMLQYASHYNQQLVWVSLDKKDNDLKRFMAHLLGALAFANLISEDQIKHDTKLLLSDLECVWSVVTNLMHQCTEPILLVLDNADCIGSPQVLDHINSLIEHAPSHLQILIASRSKPRIALGKQRAAGLLLELHNDDLAFTASEIEELCSHQAKVVAGTGEVHRLRTLTEGWITGIRLWLAAYKDLNGQSLHALPVSNLAYQYIEEYFTEEVITPLAPHGRQLLLKTSIVNHFNQSLARVLTQQSDGVVKVEALFKQNLFLESVGSKQGWYRYHPLLQHSLYQKLSLQGPEHTRELHRRAADWLLEVKSYGESLYQYGRSHDIAALLVVLEKYSFELIREGKVNEIVNSLENIPALLGDDHFTFVMIEASVVHVIKDSVRIKACIGRLQRLLQSPPSYANAERLRQTSLYLRAHIAYLGGNLHYGIRLCDMALQRQEKPNAAVSVLRFHRANCHFALGYLSSAYQDAIQALSELQKYGLTGYTNSLNYLLGQIEIAQGKAQKALHRYQQMQPVADSANASYSFYDVYYFLGMGLVHMEQNQLSTAESYLKQAVTAALGVKQTAILPWTLHQLALMHFCRDNLDEAARVWEEAITIARDHQLYGIYRLCSSYRVRVALMSSEENIRVEQWLGEWDQVLQLYGEHTLPEERLTYGWVQYHQGSWNESFRTSERLIAELKDQGNISLLIDAYILMSHLLYSKKRNEMALKAFNQAVELCVDHSIPRLFLLEGRKLLPLVQLALSDKARLREAIQAELSHGAFVETLMASSLLETAAPSGLVILPLFEQLTKREGDVLKLMMTGQSNQEIAGTLFIGISTVKTHINSLFRKLDVTTRQEACRAAKSFQAGD